MTTPPSVLTALIERVYALGLAGQWDDATRLCLDDVVRQGEANAADLLQQLAVYKLWPTALAVARAVAATQPSVDRALYCRLVACMAAIEVQDLTSFPGDLADLARLATAAEGQGMANYLNANVMAHAVLDAYRTSDWGRLAQLQAAAAALQPNFARCLGGASIDYPALIRAPAAAPPVPPIAPPRPGRRVILVQSARFGDASCRANEIEVRLQLALAARGWEVLSIPNPVVGDIRHSAETYGRVLHCLADVHADLILFDGFGLCGDGPGLDHGAMAQALRTRSPGVKLVSFYPDPYLVADRPKIVQVAPHLDLIWSCSTDIWTAPDMRTRVFMATLPCGIAPPAPDVAKPRDRRALFRGSVVHANFHRAFWLADLGAAAPLVRVDAGTYDDDGLSVTDSYGRYLADISGAAMLLNFAMRRDGELVITGRAFEAALVGALLLQEDNPEMAPYLAAGRHYLPFVTMSDLRNLLAFCAANPEVVDDLGAQARRYAEMRYSNDAVIGALEARLFS